MSDGAEEELLGWTNAYIGGTSSRGKRREILEEPAIPPTRMDYDDPPASHDNNNASVLAFLTSQHSVDSTVLPISEWTPYSGDIQPQLDMDTSRSLSATVRRIYTDLIF